MVTKVITGYPQMPPLTQEELEAFLKKPGIARLATMNEDGTIHLAPLFFKYDNGEIILGTQEVSQRVRNIKRNPNVTLLVDVTAPELVSVTIYGKARLEYDQVIEKRTAIFAQYGGSVEDARKKAEGLARKWKSVVIRIKPDRIVSVDYSKASLL